MNPAVWDLYVSLQTEMAYQGWQPPALDEHAVSVAMEFHRSLISDVLGPEIRGLLIGPGGINEVEALRRSGLTSLTVVTAHPAEAAALIQQGQGPAWILTADMHDLPLPSGSVDLVYAANVLEHALAPYIALLELRRVLREGGTGYFVLPSFAGVEGGTGPFHLHCLTDDVWRELLRKTGFSLTDVRIHDHTGNQSVLDNRTGTYAERTGCAHYVSYRVRAVTPPHPHSVVFARLKALKP